MTELKKNETLSRKLLGMGAAIFFLMGLVHIIGALIDIFRPFLYTPADYRVKEMMIESTMLITGRTSLWKAWLGFNISHGLGISAFSLVIFMIAWKKYSYFIEIKPLFPAILFIIFIYFLICIFFWFYLPAIGIGIVLCLFIASFFQARQG